MTKTTTLWTPKNMSEPIKRLTDSGRNALLQLTEAKPDLWQNPEADFEAELRGLGIGDYAEEIGVISHGLIELPNDLGYNRVERSKMDRNATGILRHSTGLKPEASRGRPSLGMVHPLQTTPIRLRTVATDLQCQRPRTHSTTLVRPRRQSRPLSEQHRITDILGRNYC